MGINLDSLSIDELRKLIDRANIVLVARRRKNEALRREIEKKAREAGISAEDAAILFGR